MSRIYGKYRFYFSKYPQKTKNSKYVETKRYVAIVPYRSHSSDSTDWNIVLHSLVLIFRLTFGLLFSVIRCFMQNVFRGGRRMSERRTTFMHSTAAMLGTSCGTDVCFSGAERIIVFFISIIGMLSSMLFTGSMFEYLFTGEIPQQINTMAELAASNLSIRKCEMLLGDERE